MALSRELSLLAVGDDEGIITLYHSQDYSHLRSVNPNHGWLISLTFGPTGIELAAAGEEHGISIWCMPTLKQLTRIDVHKNWVASIDWREPRWLTSSSQDNTIQLYERMLPN